MKLQLNPLIGTEAIAGGAQAIGGGEPPGKAPAAAPAPGDGIDISNVFAALDQSTRIGRIAAAVQGGSYQASSAATGNALVEDALSGRN